jgi:starch phosphorylase
MFIFGMTADQVATRRAAGYDPQAEIDASEELKRALQSIESGAFSPEETEHAKLIVNRLRSVGEPFMVLADYRDYVRAQGEVDRLYRDADAWSLKAAINCLSMGRFSSDRSVREYAEHIWSIKPVI